MLLYYYVFFIFENIPINMSKYFRNPLSNKNVAYKYNNVFLHPIFLLSSSFILDFNQYILKEPMKKILDYINASISTPYYLQI